MASHSVRLGDYTVTSALYTPTAVEHTTAAEQCDMDVQIAQGIQGLAALQDVCGQLLHARDDSGLLVVLLRYVWLYWQLCLGGRGWMVGFMHPMHTLDTHWIHT